MIETRFMLRQDDDALRLRLKRAVRNIEEPPGLADTIGGAIRSEREVRGWPALRTPYWTASIAAALILCASIAIAYDRGHLRLTRASEDSYIASISRPVASLLRVGLGDHVHCAVFRKSTGKPSFGQFARDLGPEYAPLAPTVAKLVPAAYMLTSAHRCRYRGRQFVHFTFRSEDALVSLVISRKGPGESFGPGGIEPVLRQSNLDIYQQRAQRFSVAGFESGDHLVYVVSGLQERQNLDLMLALASPIKSFLNKGNS